MLVIDEIKALMLGKGADLDKLQVEHFKFVNVQVLRYIFRMLHTMYDIELSQEYYLQKLMELVW